VAAALAAVLGDRQRARAMGRAGRQRAMTEFGPDRCVTIVERVYRSLV
jgi:glycosyltransferase involved in cell wall biosynthesis